MKKLLVSIATLGSGGAERVLSILSKPLADSFDEVQYVKWEEGESFYNIDERIRIISLPQISKKRGRSKQISTFRNYVKKEKPNLILSFLTPYNMLVLLSAVGLKQKIVVAERTDPNRLLTGGRFALKLRDHLYKRADGILTQTQYAKSCYDVKFANKTKVIYNPVTMTEDQVGAAIRAEKEKLFVSVGRLEAVKDQTMMIEAFSQFHQCHPDYRLVIYGEGPMRQQLESFINQKGLNGCITLPGNNNKVWDAMLPAECFLLSSEYEGMSNAMIEAMCLGLPVISTKVAGATDLIKDGENGYLVNVKDSDAMANRMCQLVEDESSRRSMGTEAAKVYEKLRADVICQQWVDYLKGMLKD